jgi:transmembrane sensor
MEKMYTLFNIARLIAKEKSEKLSDSENSILKQWLTENDKNKTLYQKMKNNEFLSEEIRELKNIDAHKAYRKAFRIIVKESRQLERFRLVRTYMKYAAVIALLVIPSYFILRHIQLPKVITVAQSNILPGRQKAILITSTNQQIILDSATHKQIQINESASIFQNGSTLSYTAGDSTRITAKEIAYNTLITPLGGEYSVVLSDGTEVMLNAGSGLKYPVVFAGHTREVILEGEAFFKVAKSHNVPFIVKTNKVNTIVYGTVFDVSAYNDDAFVQTTLVEGSVGISVNGNQPEQDVKLAPGQQFNYHKDTRASETKEVNASQFVAWTNRMFVFENEPIENILKTMSRWYNFSYEFENESLKIQRFTISIGRYDHVSKILDLIAASSNLKFAAKENTIIVDTK